MTRVVMIKGLLLLVLLILVGIVDIQAIGDGERLPSDWFQIGVTTFLIGILVTRSAVEGLKRRYYELDNRPAEPSRGQRRLIISVILAAAALFMAVYGASLYAAVFGFLIGCLAHATWRIREINEYNGKIKQLQPKNRQAGA